MHRGSTTARHRPVARRMVARGYAAPPNTFVPLLAGHPAGSKRSRRFPPMIRSLRTTSRSRGRASGASSRGAWSRSRAVATRGRSLTPPIYGRAAVGAACWGRVPVEPASSLRHPGRVAASHPFGPRRRRGSGGCLCPTGVAGGLADHAEVVTASRRRRRSFRRRPARTAGLHPPSPGGGRIAKRAGGPGMIGGSSCVGSRGRRALEAWAVLSAAAGRGLGWAGVGVGVVARVLMLGTSVPMRIAPAAKMAAVTQNAVV